MNGNLGCITSVTQVAIGGCVIPHKHRFDGGVAGCGSTTGYVNGKGRFPAVAPLVASELAATVCSNTTGLASLPLILTEQVWVLTSPLNCTVLAESAMEVLENAIKAREIILIFIRNPFNLLFPIKQSWQ